MRIRVDTSHCVGAGQCVLSAPDFFDQGEDGLVTMLQQDPGGSEEDAVRQAAELCPSGSITIAED